MHKHAASLLTLCLLFLLAGLLPAAISLFSTLSDGPALTSFITGFNLRAFFNTMVMGLAVGLTACVAGFTIAYTIVNTRGFVSKTARTLFPIALFAPSVMPAIGLIYSDAALWSHRDLFGGACFHASSCHFAVAPNSRKVGGRTDIGGPITGSFPLKMLLNNYSSSLPCRTH